MSAFGLTAGKDKKKSGFFLSAGMEKPVWTFTVSRWIASQEDATNESSREM